MKFNFKLNSFHRQRGISVKFCLGPNVWMWPFWVPSQYPKRRLSVRSRKVSKPRDLYLELSDRSAIWQALRQRCCRCACQISKRYENLKYQSRGFETLRDLTERRLFGYWDGALFPWVWFWMDGSVWFQATYPRLYFGSASETPQDSTVDGLWTFSSTAKLLWTSGKHQGHE